MNEEKEYDYTEPYKARAKMTITIPWGNDWNIKDIEDNLKRLGIQSEVTAIMLGLKIPKTPFLGGKLWKKNSKE